MRVAEYLGYRTDIDSPAITPVVTGQAYKCPFMESFCPKIKDGNKPVCSVRKNSGELWICCKNRLCSSRKNMPLSSHQVGMLSKVANLIFVEGSVAPDNILIKREESMRVSKKCTYRADFVMVHKLLYGLDHTKVIIEMQGGGETSNTGDMTKHVDEWEKNPSRTNKQLNANVAKVGSIETNAWRRQQEQFIVKGNIVNKTGGKIVFCVGAPLYNYLIEKIPKSSRQEDLRNANWTLALLCINEDTAQLPKSGPIPLTVDEKRLLFTDYRTFVNELTNQGGPAPQMFKGGFLALDGRLEEVP